ncbi:MAG: phospho-N-acetylmuramoyl-pentapeptide-transferase [Bacillota bacterium]|nr:phospho-N-acetylmuramoyl-pentapeptide-transferase [Bacillota bacterium]
MDYKLLALPIVIAFVLTAVATPLFIPLLKRLKAGQSIREEGPQSHQAKAGTPTMGGIVLLLTVVVTCLTAGRLNGDMFILLAAFAAFGALGFADDFIKVVQKRNLGLTAKQKFLLQILVAVVLAVYQQQVSVYGSRVFVPLVDIYWDLGWFYVPFVVFVVVAMVNAVNLTDGLDGLAAGVTVPVALFLALAGAAFGFASTRVFCGALAGACLGFLLYNRHPARLFMGDTGSLALGGGLAAAAILMNVELLLPLAGGVYVLEALSVVLQVAYFKKTGGKRLFRMAPLHHHFELKGWKETRVVRTAVALALVLSVCSWLLTG